MGIIRNEIEDDGTMRARPSRQRSAWREQAGDVALFALVGWEAVNRSPKVTACHEELERVLDEVRAIPGGKELANRAELAALGLWTDSVDLAAAVAASAALKLDIERLYAAAVWDMSLDLSLMEDARPSQGEAKSRSA